MFNSLVELIAFVIRLLSLPKRVVRFLTVVVVFDEDAPSDLNGSSDTNKYEVEIE